MEQRVLATENKQQQMMSFLAKALQDPRFLAQLLRRQSESHHNNRLATMRGRKQRFLKHDSTGSEEERMLNTDSAQQPEGQMMPYYNNNQPSNGDVNPMETDDEAVIMQLLDSIEAVLSPTSPDDNGEQLLDVLFRSSSPSDHPELTTPSGVTLTELDMSGLPESTLPVTDPVMGTLAPLDDQELQELLELQAPPASQTSGLETGALSLEIDSSLNPTEKTNTETGKMNSSNDHSIGASNALETSFCDGEGMSSCTASPAANKDDILWDWEHFFSPASISPLDLVPSKIDFGATDEIPEKTNTTTGKMNSSNDDRIAASNALETSFCDGEGMSSCTGSPAANKDEILWDWEHFFRPASISPLDLVPSKIDFGATDQIPELGEF